MAYALQGTGWSVGKITVSTKRSWQSTDKNALSMLRTNRIAGKQQTVFRIQQADPILRMSEGLDHLQLTSPQIKYLSFLDGIHTILMKIRNRICYRRFSVIFFSIQLSLDKGAAYIWYLR